MTTVEKLQSFNRSQVSLGPVEQMYGGTGYKASFSPAAHVCFPALRVPWKIAAQRYQGGNPSAKLAMSVTENNPEVQQFVEYVDNMALQYLNAHKKDFFPGKKMKTAVEDLFMPSLKASADGSFPPVFRAKMGVGQDDGSDIITTPCFNMTDKEVIDPNVMLDKGALVNAVIQPAHVYVINNTAGVTWKVVRVGVAGFAAEDSSNRPVFDFGA